MGFRYSKAQGHLTAVTFTNASGDSRISMEDYAIALADELEEPKHERSRFSIGYQGANYSARSSSAAVSGRNLYPFQ
jgi:hypothetical protein